MSTSPAIFEAARAACAHLVARQAPDGHFREYALPVGHSDQWVTALAGLTLAEAGARGVHPDALAAAGRAAAWLVRARRYPAGWGYNGITGPDADSTAHALQLFAALGRPVEERDVAWLVTLKRYRAGFATYDRNDGWGEPHPDVTPQVFFALPVEERIAFGEDLAAWAAGARDRDGTWPAYWWRGRDYSTYWNLRMLAALGAPVEAPSALAPGSSSFELAWAIGVVGQERARALGWIDRLLGAQSPDGRWPGGADLRVTDARLRRPWAEAPRADDRSAYYTDGGGLVTTAAAIRILVDAIGQPRAR